MQLMEAGQKANYGEAVHRVRWKYRLMDGWMDGWMDGLMEH
jgi:hypothetical protein